MIINFSHQNLDLIYLALIIQASHLKFDSFNLKVEFKAIL